MSDHEHMAEEQPASTVPVETLSPYHRNPRRGNTGAITESLAHLGQYRPIVVNQGTYTGRPLEVLAGNHTLYAARQLGWDTINIVTVDVDDATAARIVLVDNRTADLATNDDAVLAALLTELPDLTATGYTGDDLAELIAATQPRQTNGDPDDAPGIPAEPVTEPGDVWVLGPHRVLCGDATNPQHLDLATNGLGTPGIVYTDPPYGIAIAHSGKVGGGGPFGGVRAAKQRGDTKVIPSSDYRPVIGDETTETAAAAFRLAFATYPEAAHVWWGGNHYAASANLPDTSCWLVWDKENTGNFADAELAWTNHPGAVRLLRHMWNGMVRASERGKRVHPTQKPVALAEWAFSIIDPKKERHVVLDVFGGSGSTLIAAHATGRTASVIEMEPAYVDVICRRYQNATGDVPHLLNGQAHNFRDD